MKRFVAVVAACVLASASSLAAGQADTWSGRGLRAESPDTIPADFRGRITYSGTYQADVTSSRGRTRQLSGGYTIEISYDGSAISGRYSGTGGMNPGSITGTRSGTRCRTLDTQSGMTNEAECTRTRFAVVARAQGAQNSSIARIEATATRFVDAAEEARQQRAAAAASAERAQIRQAEAQRATRAETARIAAMPRANAAQTRMLSDAIGQDSRSWRRNRYDAGSLSNVRISGNGMLRGDYTYNGGERGWLEGRIASGRVQCIQYHDTSGCAPVRVASAAAPSGTGNRPNWSESNNLPQARQITRCVRITAYTLTSYSERFGQLGSSYEEQLQNSCDSDEALTQTCTLFGRPSPPAQVIIPARSHNVQYNRSCIYSRGR